MSVTRHEPLGIALALHVSLDNMHFLSPRFDLEGWTISSRRPRYPCRSCLMRMQPRMDSKIMLAVNDRVYTLTTGEP